MKQISEINQLHRLAGQIQGIENMMKNGEKTTKILQQLEAACGSLKSLEKKLLRQELKDLKNQEIQHCFDYLCRQR